MAVNECMRKIYKRLPNPVIENGVCAGNIQHLGGDNATNQRWTYEKQNMINRRKGHITLNRIQYDCWRLYKAGFRYPL